MLSKAKGIVLKKIDYSDNSVIVKIYTNLNGMQSYLVNGIKGKRAAIKPSHLLPLTLVEIEAYHQQNKNLQRIKELKCVPILNNLHFNIQKSTVALFIAEVISKTIVQENNADENLFDFLFNCIQFLDMDDENTANFPLLFLLKLSRFLGFNPKQNYSDTDCYFSINQGCFVNQSFFEPNVCDAEVSLHLSKLLAADFTNYGTVLLNQNLRNSILDVILNFYTLHEIGLGNLNSYKVFKQVFS